MYTTYHTQTRSCTSVCQYGLNETLDLHACMCTNVGMHECQNCGVGRFLKSPSTAEAHNEEADCLTCEEDQISDDVAAEGCNNCPVGTFTNGVDRGDHDHIDDCHSCDAGKEYQSSTPHCQNCPAGKYRTRTFQGIAPP